MNYISLIERLYRINEYISVADFQQSFDETFSEDAFREMCEDPEEAEDGFLYLEDLIDKARPIVNSWVDQLKNAGKTRVPFGVPTMWLETSDAYDMAYEGDWTGFESVLQEIIDYGPVIHPEHLSR